MDKEGVSLSVHQWPWQAPVLAARAISCPSGSRRGSWGGARAGLQACRLGGGRVPHQLLPGSCKLKVFQEEELCISLFARERKEKSGPFSGEGGTRAQAPLTSTCLCRGTSEGAAPLVCGATEGVTGWRPCLPAHSLEALDSSDLQAVGAAGGLLGQGSQRGASASLRWARLKMDHSHRGQRRGNRRLRKTSVPEWATTA